MDSAALYVAVSLVGTILALYFSLTIIPFQQVAAAYSPALFRYIRKDSRLLTTFALAAALLIFELALPFFRVTRFTLTLAYLGVAAAFGLIAYLWVWSTRLLNPAEYLIPAIVMRGQVAARQEMATLQRQAAAPGQRMRDLEEMMTQAMNTADRVEPETRFFQVRRGDVGATLREARTMKDLCLSFLSTGQTDMFRTAFDSLITIAQAYLRERREYISHNDEVLMDVSDDVRDIVAATRQRSNIHAARAVWRGLEQLAISSLDITVIGTRTGHHELATPLTEVIRSGVTQDVLSGNIDSAYEAIRSLGEIATACARRGFAQTAATIVEHLFAVAQLGARLRQPSTNAGARQQIAEIFFQCLHNRVLFTNFDLPYVRLMRCYDALLSTPDGNSPGVSDPISWWNPDPAADRSIAALVRAALFPTRAAEDARSHNYDVAHQLIELLERHYPRDTVTQMSFDHQVYQVALWLLTIVAPSTAPDIRPMFAPDDTHPAPALQVRAQDMLFEVIDWLFDAFVRSCDPRTKIVEPAELLNGLLSIYYLLMVLEVRDGLDLSTRLEDTMRRQLASLHEIQEQLDLGAEEWTSLMHFTAYLRRSNRFRGVRRQVDVILRVHRPRRYQFHGLHVLDHVKRPISAFRQGVFVEVEREVFGHDDGAQGAPAR